MALDHLAHSERKRNRHNGGQTFRHGGNRKADGDDKYFGDLLCEFLEISQRTCEQLADIRLVDQRDDKNNRNQNQRADAERPAQLVEPSLQRRFFGFHILQHGGDQTQLGVHACAGDHAASASIIDDRAHEGGILSVAKRNIFLKHSRRVLLHGK